MLVAIPVLLLTITVLFVWLFTLLKLRPGIIWLFSAVAVLLAWGTMILIGILQPAPIVIENFLPEANSFTTPVFSYNEQTWGIGFLLISLLTSVIFFEAKHLDSPDYIRKLSGSILLTSIALLAVMADSFLTFVLAWALIDLIEFGVLAVLMGGQSRGFISAATSILFRVVGLFLLMLFIAIIPMENGQSVPDEIMSPYWGLIIFIVLFRMGTLPLFQPYVSAPAYQRGIVTILRIVPLATTFAFIQKIARAGILPTVGGVIFIIFIVAILWGSISWFTAENELKGRPFFLFSMASFGLLALLTGSHQAVTGLSVILIAGGGGLFLYSPRLKKVNPFLILLIISLLSLPFTPSASISNLFDNEGTTILKAGIVIGLAFLIAGLIKHGWKQDESEAIPERWMSFFHFMGLYFIAFAPWFLVLVFWNAQSQYLQWWGLIPITIVCLVIGVAFSLLRSRLKVVSKRYTQVDTGVTTIFRVLSGLLKFNWLSSILIWFGRLITRLVNGLAQVMEGDGGILWSFLFIALLLSLLLTRQVP